MRHRSLLYALLVVAGLIVTGVTRPDAAESPEQLKAACDKGTAVACEDLGHLYLNGTGVKQDDSHAVALFRRACDRGAMGGCSSLAWMYQEGRGVDQDDKQAVALFRKACDGEGLQAAIILVWRMRMDLGSIRTTSKP